MTTPIDITDSLKALGINESGATADKWRAEMSANIDIANHLKAIAAAVAAAKQRAETALDHYYAAAPTPAEIQAAQQELLAASLEDDPSNPDRLTKAQDKLGELLAREQAATEKYGQDSTENTEQLAADQLAAEEELSPQARAKLQQLLSSLAGAAAQPMGPQPTGAPAPAGYPGAGAGTALPTGSGYDSGLTPSSSYDPATEPPVTHSASGPAPTAEPRPTLVNATTTAPTGAPPNTGLSAPPSGSSGAAPRGAGGGFMPPMGMGGMAGMGAGGAKPPTSQGEDSARSESDTSIDRDETLNGDDMLNRTVQDRL